MKYLILIVVIFFSPFFTFAALDVVYSGNGTISSGGQSVTVGDGGTVDSITVDTNSFDVVLSGGATISLTNSNGNELRAPVENSVSKTTACSSNSSVITLKQETSVGGTNTVTVTPLSTSCQTTASSGASSGDGGLVRSSPVPVAKTLVQSQLPQATPLPASPVFSEFKVNLYYGAKGNDVRRLQELLATDSVIYPEGIVSGYFGPKTLAAIKRFQGKYGISQIGTVGPLTRAKLNKIFGGTKNTSEPSVSQTGLSSSLDSEIEKQSKIKDLLKQLQILQEQLNVLRGKK